MGSGSPPKPSIPARCLHVFPGTGRLWAASIEVYKRQSLTNKAGTSLTNDAGVSLTNKAGAEQTVDGGGMLTIKGGLVKVN